MIVFAVALRNCCASTACRACSDGRRLPGADAVAYDVADADGDVDGGGGADGRRSSAGNRVASARSHSDPSRSVRTFGTERHNTMDGTGGGFVMRWRWAAYVGLGVVCVRVCVYV